MRTMLAIKERPYGLLLLTAIALMTALVFYSIFNVDIQDTSAFSIPLFIAVWIFPLILIIFWLLYLLTKRLLYSMTIAWIHVATTVCAAILIVTVLYIGVHPSQFINNRPELIGNAMQALLILFVCGHLLYLANVIIGIFSRQKVQ